MLSRGSVAGQRSPAERPATRTTIEARLEAGLAAMDSGAVDAAIASMRAVAEAYADESDLQGRCERA